MKFIRSCVLDLLMIILISIIVQEKLEGGNCSWLFRLGWGWEIKMIKYFNALERSQYRQFKQGNHDVLLRCLWLIMENKI